MILDAQHQFSDSQALTATATSTNEVDLGVDQDIGNGEPMGVVIVVEVAADTASGNETYQFDVRTDDNAGMSSATVIASRDINRDSLTAGSVHTLPIPDSNERYLDLNYTLGGTTPSVTVSAYLQPMSMIESAQGRTYADGFTITS